MSHKIRKFTRPAIDDIELEDPLNIDHLITWLMTAKKVGATHVRPYAYSEDVDLSALTAVYETDEQRDKRLVIEAAIKRDTGARKRQERLAMYEKLHEEFGN